MNAPLRHVILVRHAHAEWPAYAGRDFERPLTEQGMADARAAASAILEAGHRADLIISSPARRTLQTAQIIAGTLGLPETAVRYVDAMYNAAPDLLDAQLRQALHHANSVILVAHNPGISELARRVTSNAKLAPLRPAHWLYATYYQIETGKHA